MEYEETHKRRRKKKAGGSCEGERGHRRLDRPGRKRQMGGVSPPMGGAGAMPQQGAMPPAGQPQPSPQQIQQMQQMMAARQAQAAGAPQGMMRPPGQKRGGKTPNWIQETGVNKPGHKGRLHRALGVPEGKPIPEGKLEKAAHSSSSHMRHMAQFAENVKGLGHKKG